MLLQTARVKLFNSENPERSIEVRAVLDTGSQQSYATKKVKDVLALRCHMHEKQTMSVLTFGKSDKKTQTYDVVRIGVTTRDSQEQEMEFVCNPLICQPLTVPSTSARKGIDIWLVSTSQTPTMGRMI